MRRAGASGKYKEALADLERAAGLAPQWPYPLYDMAFTYLLMKDFEKRESIIERRSSWHLAGSSLPSRPWILSRGKRRAIFRLGPTLHTCPWSGRRTPGRKWRKCENSSNGFQPSRGLERTRGARGRHHREAHRHRKWFEGKSRRQTMGVLQINKALILSRMEDYEGAVRFLGELVFDPASTYATEHMGKVALASIAKR